MVSFSNFPDVDIVGHDVTDYPFDYTGPVQGVKNMIFLADAVFRSGARVVSFVTHLKNTNAIYLQIWRRVSNSTYDLLFQTDRIVPTLDQINKRLVVRT